MHKHSITDYSTTKWLTNNFILKEREFWDPASFWTWGFWMPFRCYLQMSEGSRLNSAFNVHSLQRLTLQQSFLVQHFMYRYIFLQSYFCLVTIIKCTLKLVQSNKSTIYSAVIAWQQSWAVLLNKLHSYVNPTLSAVELRAHCIFLTCRKSTTYSVNLTRNCCKTASHRLVACGC